MHLMRNHVTTCYICDWLLHVDFFDWSPLYFLCSGSHENWLGISLSVDSYKEILYLENLEGGPVKKVNLLVFKAFYYNLLLLKVTMFPTTKTEATN